MKIVASICALCFLFNNVVAQPQISEGTSVKFNKKLPVKIIGNTPTDFFVLRAKVNQSGKKSVIEKYSIAEMKLKSTVDVGIDVGRKSEILDAFFFKDRFLIFRTVTDRKKKKSTLLMQTVFENGQTNSKVEEVFQISSEFVDSNPYAFADIDFILSLSPDSSMLLMVAQKKIITYESRKIEKTLVKLFDVNLFKLKWEKEVPTTYEKSKTSQWNYKIDNQENIYFFLNYINSSNRTQSVLACIQKDNISPTGVDIGISTDQYLEDIRIELDSSTIYCTGIYQKRRSQGETAKFPQLSSFGVFCQIINKNTFQTSSFDSQPFSETITKKIEMMQYYYNSIKLDHIKIINGEVYSVAELYYPYTELFVFKTNKLGKIEWVNAINKKYIPAGKGSQYIYATYYHVFATKDNLHIIFNEHRKNNSTKKGKPRYELDLKKYKSYEKIKRTNVIDMQIGSSGTIDRTIMRKNKRYSLLFLPKTMHWRATHFPTLQNLIYPLSNNKCIIYLKHDKGKALLSANIRGADKFASFTFK